MGKHAFWTASFKCLAKSLASRINLLNTYDIRKTYLSTDYYCNDHSKEQCC